MSFGWSAGDIYNACILIKNISDAFRRIPEAKREFRDSMHFLDALEANLDLIHTYVDKSSSNRSGLSAEAIDRLLGVVQTELQNFITFLHSKQALREYVETARTRKKIQSMLQAVRWGIRDLNKKVQEMKQALTQVLAVLGLYLTYELNSLLLSLLSTNGLKLQNSDTKNSNHLSAVSENVENIEQLVRENQQIHISRLDQADDLFEKAVKSIQNAQVDWELLLRDTMHDWTATTKDQSTTHVSRLEDQTKTIDLLKATVEEQTKAFQTMRIEMQETMNQVGEAMQIVLKRIDDDIQIDNAKDSTIVQKSKRVHKQQRSLENLLLASTQAEKVIAEAAEKAKYAVSPVQIATLFKNLDIRLKQIGISSIMHRFVNNSKTVHNRVGRGSIRTIKALQQAWASIVLKSRNVFTKEQPLMPQIQEREFQVEISTPGFAGGDNDRPESAQPTRTLPTLIPAGTNPFQESRLQPMPWQSQSQPDLYGPPNTENTGMRPTNSSSDLRKEKAPPPPRPQKRPSLTAMRTHSVTLPGPSTANPVSRSPIATSEPSASHLIHASSPLLRPRQSSYRSARPPPIPTQLRAL